MALHQGRMRRLLTTRAVDWQGQTTVLGIICTCISCISDVRMPYVLVILCVCLPITTTVSGEWLNSLIFHDDIKCITAYG